MTLEKKLEALKKYNYYENYDEGRFIDAQDSVNLWCLGQIAQFTDSKTMRVHFDGWSSKWDLVSELSVFLPISFDLILAAFLTISVCHRSVSSHLFVF